MFNRSKNTYLFSKRSMAAAIVAATFITGVSAQDTSSPIASDADIAAAIERQFLRDAAVPLGDIEVIVERGIVTLDGEVATLMARRQAEDLAGIVRGVRSIVDRIRLVPSTKSAEELRRDIRGALRANPVAESYEIEVSADEMAHVIIAGEVDSWAEKDQVETVVMTVPGVMDLSNRLAVTESAAPRGLAEITEEIEARLRWDARVDDSLINVLTLDGQRVLLSGTVGSLAEKRHAERLARVAGVREVRSTQLEIEPWARNSDLRRAGVAPTRDAEIRDAVIRALRYDPRVLQEHVEITVRDGVVALNGVVESPSAKRSVEQDTINTTGVIRVNNGLELRAGLRDDSAISQLIGNALRGYGLTPQNDISVEVNNGSVRLIGDVHTASAHWQAEEVAMAVRGVADVRNEMTINGQRPVLLTRLYGFSSELDRMVTTDDEPLPTDREIYDGVQSEIFWSPFVDSEDVTVEVDDGVVTLSGYVDSGREYQAAQVNAFQGGALSVNNELMLRP